jgi:hypothetical protein
MEDAGGKPVFNFVSEGRSFADSDRALILATGHRAQGREGQTQGPAFLRAEGQRMVLDRRSRQA